MEAIRIRPLQHFKNLKVDPKTFKPIEITGLLTLKELEYVIKTRANIQLRSKRCERAYQRFKKRSRGNLFANLMDEKVQLRPNNFPYNLEHKLEHYILWYHGTWEAFEENYKNLCKRHNPALYWINLKEHRSVETPHAHIILKRK